MELCRFLRWKGYYGRRWTSTEDLEAVLEANEVQYSCLRTCEAWGPDDTPAALDCCGSARRCFEPSKIGPGAALT